MAGFRIPKPWIPDSQTKITWIPVSGLPYMGRKVPCPEESGRIESRENVYFANGNYERRSSKLAMKMPTAELYLKEATVIYGFYLLTARLPELT